MKSSEREQLQQLLQKYLQGKCTPEEAARVRAWYETLDWYEADPELSDENRQDLKQKMWQGIRERLPEMEPEEGTPATEDQHQPGRPLLRGWLRMGVAASLLLLLGWAFWTFRTHRQPTAGEQSAESLFVEKVNRSGRAMPYHLEDGTVVWLKNSSLLRYPRDFSRHGREVYLEGEAFFEVAHNAQRPFRVYSNQLVVRVLGTSFTVKAHPQDSVSEVSVRSGRVSVYALPANKDTSGRIYSSDELRQAAEETSEILTPNQKIIFYPAERQLVKSQLKERDFWKKEEELHLLTFRDTPLQQVMQSLEESYGVTIRFENAALNQCTLTATLGNQPLDTKLEMICKSIGATFERREQAIYIRGRGC